jgi:trk system potassium uptake protein TrkH
VDKQTLKNIAKLLGSVGIYLSLFFLFPIATGWYYGEDIFLFLLFDILFFLLNGTIFLYLKNHDITLSLKDGILSVNLIWILVGFAGAVPLWLYSNITFMQAIFESISGFTTTGATIYSDIESLPNMILILRSLMHWIGGMGILVLGVGLLSLINPSGSLALFKAEASGIKLDKSTPKIKDTAMMLWGIYIVLTFFDAILLKLGGMSTFDAINHAFSTISTGGFSTKNSSFGAFESPFILWTTTFFMVISGITFLAHLKAFRGELSGYKNEETKWYIIIFILLSLFMGLFRYQSSDDTFFTAMTHASFNIAALMTTTGFASLDYEAWGQMAVSIAFLAMLASGNGGSTAGGVKIIRYVVSIKVLFVELKKILHPSAIIKVFINNSPVSNSLISMTFGFILLFVITNAIITFYLYASGYDMMTSLSSALACVGNIGPGFSQVGPAQNYGFYDSLDLFVLSLGMIIGRLEVFTFLLIFLPSFWKKF